MSALLDEIAVLEAEAAEAADLRIENAVLVHDNDELRQSLADREEEVDTLKGRVALLEDQIGQLQHATSEYAANLTENCIDFITAVDHWLGVRSLPFQLRIAFEHVCEVVGLPW